jgi:hypothetical protein
MNVVMSASEKMRQLVGEQDRQQGQRKRQPGDQRGRLAVQERERVKEFVEGKRLAVGVGNGKLRASDQASAQRQQEQPESNEKRPQRRVWRNRPIVSRECRLGAPIEGWGGNGGGAIWERVGHGSGETGKVWRATTETVQHKRAISAKAWERRAANVWASDA